jgi:PAS domain S-box-containing protein
MKFNLKLSQQGWLFLGVMLLVELFFIGEMFKLTQEAAVDSAKYQHKVDVMNRGAALLLSTYKGGYCLAFYGMSHKASYGEAFDKFSKELPQQIQDLKDKSWPEDRAGVENLCGIVSETLKKLNRYRVDADESGDITLGPLRKELMPTLTGLLKELDKGTEEKQGAAEEQERRSIQNRMNTLWVLACGFIVNVGMGIWFMWWYTKTITGKLDVLFDNTLRLASGAPLSEPLKGNDEISQVDHIFHNMASALVEASQKERLATEILRASEERVRGIIDHMPVGLIEFNKDGKINSVNPRTEEMWCCKETDLVGKHVSQLFRGKVSDDAASFMSFIEQDAIGKFAELTARRIIGASFPAEITVTELKSREEPTLLASVQDVTQRHEVERLKREFVAMVSHDLRTPLTSVHGSLTLLSAGALGEISSAAHEVVTTAESELERLTKLVGDLLDVAKIEAGKMEVKAMPTALQPIISRSIASISNFAERQGVSVKADRCEAQVLADSERLVQVLVNLLSNAVKFSPADSVVSISSKIVDDMLEVCVTDQGRGVPAEHQQAVFERFHQVEGADATQKKGTGLGLPICKQIIEQHGGAIGVRSQLGEGSTFWFTIPLVHADQSNSREQTAAADSTRETADLR